MALIPISPQAKANVQDGGRVVRSDAGEMASAASASGKHPSDARWPRSGRNAPLCRFGRLPPYLASGNVIPKGEVRTNVLLYAPKGGRVDDVRVTGGDQGVFSQTHNGLAVVGKTVQLKPGQQIVIDYDILTGQGQQGIPVLRVTPVTLGRTAITASSGCS